MEQFYDFMKTSVLPLPLQQKLLVLAATFLVIVGLYVYLGWLPLHDDLQQQQQQLATQQKLLKKNQEKANNLPRKKKEYAALEKQLKVALHMLPKQSQIPDLLENVSWAGKDSGLEFKEFKPGREKMKQLYAEVPVSFQVEGSFRQLLTFLRRVGEMSRIVDVKDVQLERKGSDRLSVSGQAVTYRFVVAKPKPE